MNKLINKHSIRVDILALTSNLVFGNSDPVKIELGFWAQIPSNNIRSEIKKICSIFEVSHFRLQWSKPLGF